ncbi:hypothetical protein PanWU01x14_223550, partial [Parasponia andersonii]
MGTHPAEYWKGFQILKIEPNKRIDSVMEWQWHLSLATDIFLGVFFTSLRVLIRCCNYTE